jgi:hypothetical protein
MRKYWGKITLSALLIFIVGYGLVSAGRAVKERVVSSKGITIPLGPFVAFKLDDAKVGTIRSITIRREGRSRITGFEVRVRVNDSTAYARLSSDCRLSVNNAPNIDERTTFVCLASDSGYAAFGEVSILMNDDQGDRHLVTPLLLPNGAIESFSETDAEGRPGEWSRADSIARAVESRIQPLSRAHRDSIRAASLDREAARFKARADSIRARAQARDSGASNPPALPPKPL